MALRFQDLGAARECRPSSLRQLSPYEIFTKPLSHPYGSERKFVAMETETNRFTPRTWALSACCCFAGGIGAGFIGSVLTSLGWTIGAEVHPWVRGFGTTLLIVTIPLLILAGHCLDRFEKTTKNPSFPMADDAKSGKVY